MKKLIISCMILCGLATQAQERVHGKVNSFDTLYLYGNCQVELARGEGNTIDYLKKDTLVTFQSVDKRMVLGNRVVQHGNSLTIFDFSGTKYRLEMDRDTLAQLVVYAFPGFDCDLKRVAVKHRVDFDTKHVRVDERDTEKNRQASVSISENQLKWSETQYALLQQEFQRRAQITDSIAGEYAALSDEVRQLMTQNRSLKPKPKKNYSWDERTDYAFRWAFTNWGSSPVNGLAGVQTPGYDIRTSFSSYQIEAGYALWMNDHWRLMMDLGYESDVYKYGHTPYVEWDLRNDGTMALVPHEDGPTNGGWESRIVARYITLPITLEWRNNDNWNYSLALSVVPGLECGSYLKHIRSSCGYSESWKGSLAGGVNPFKCDVRFDMKMKGMGLFVQVPTMPLFIGEGMEKVYPIKLGFCI